MTRPPAPPRLGDLERTVMDHLWSLSPEPPPASGEVSDRSGAPSATVREVHEALEQDRAIAYTTVMTVLDRLAKKGLVTRERDGRAWRYAAATGRDQLTAEVMRQSLSRLDGDDRRSALVHFLDDASPAELDDLRQALADLEKRQPKRG